MKNNVYSRIYKLCRAFSWLIAFFIGGIFYSMTCHAQALPTIDTSTFSVIQGFNNDLINVGFLPQNLQAYFPISTQNWSPWNLGYIALSAVDENDCTISILDDSQKAALINSISPIHVNGTAVTVEENIYAVNYDNGYLSGYAYIDSNGRLLAYSDNVAGHLLQAKFGGNIKDVSDWEDMFEETSIDIYDDSFLLTDHPEYIDNVSFYLFEGTLSYGNPSSAYDLFIPNQYNKGVIVPVTTQNGSFINQWYFNSSDAYIYHTRYGIVNPLVVESGTFTKDNVSYTHRLTLNRIWYGNVANNDFFDWLNGIDKLNCIFGAQGLEYNSNIGNSTAVAFKPIQNPNGAQIINYNYYYDYNGIQNLETALNNLTSTLNQNFEYNQPISEENFPQYYPIGDTQANPSNIPFPGVTNYPGFEPLPIPNNSPLLNYEPEIQPSSQEVESSINNFGIPFFQNLQFKYPFSIPWDIKAFINSFKAEPTPPAWDFDWSITVGNTTYTHHFEGDLSEFNSLAAIFRNLLLISFIIGLCVFSYNHHF